MLAAALLDRGTCSVGINPSFVAVLDAGARVENSQLDTPGTSLCHEAALRSRERLEGFVGRDRFLHVVIVPRHQHRQTAGPVLLGRSPCSSQGCALQLQQGPVQGGRPEGHPCGQVSPSWVETEAAGRLLRVVFSGSAPAQGNH
jgi:hypothetical protein